MDPTRPQRCAGKSQFGFVLLLTAAVLHTGPVDAATSDSTGASSFEIPTPAFKTELDITAGNLFKGCTSSTIQGTFDDLSCAKAGESSSTTAPSDVSCEAMQTNDLFDDAKYKALKTQVDKAVEVAKCKQVKIKEAKVELQNCVIDPTSQLKQLIQLADTEYNTAITQAKANIKPYNDRIADRLEQKKDILQRLGGDSETTAGGLLAIKATTEAMLYGDTKNSVKSMDEDIAQVKDFHQKLEYQNKDLQTTTDAITVGYANDCLRNDSEPEFRCPKHGPVLNFQNYVTCFCAARAKTGVGGRYEGNDAHVAADAGTGSDNIGVTISNILQNMPVITTYPTTVEGLANQAGQAKGIMSEKAVWDTYGTALSQCGPDMTKFIKQQFSYCFQKALSRIHNDQRDSTSGYSAIQRQINAGLTKTNDLMKSMVSRYQQQAKDMWAAMVGLHGDTLSTLPNNPLPTAGCNSQDTHQQDACLDTLKTGIQQLYDGSNKSVLVTITIHGKSQTGGTTFACSGVEKCIDGLNNLKRNNDAANTFDDTNKKNDVMIYNQKIMAMTQNARDQLKPLVKTLTDRLAGMNAKMFALLNLPNAIKFDTVEAQELQEDPNSDNLYKKPDALKAIGGSAGLLKVDPASMTDALSGLTKAVDEMNKTDIPELNKASSLLTALGSSNSKCRTGDVKEKLKTAQSEIDQLKDCTPDECFTEKDSLGQLVDIIGKLPTGGGLKDTDLERLKSGMDRCQSKAKKKKDLVAPTLLPPVVPPDSVRDNLNFADYQKKLSKYEADLAAQDDKGNSDKCSATIDSSRDKLRALGSAVDDAKSSAGSAE